MSSGRANNWSVEAFYEWMHHDRRTTKCPTGLPVELIEGQIVPIPLDKQLNRQIERLKQQLQYALKQAGYGAIEVRSHYPIRINPHSELRPTLTVLSTDSSHPQSSHPNIHWVIDLNKAEYNNQSLSKLLYAHYGIAEYWAVSTQQVELRTYHSPAANETKLDRRIEDGDGSSKDAANYQHSQLIHVGETASPSLFPRVNVCIQESLPLFFLTRSAIGHHTYIESTLSLSVDLMPHRRENEQNLHGKVTPQRG